MRSDYIILGNSIIDGDATARLLELKAFEKHNYELERENRELKRTLRRVRNEVMGQNISSNLTEKGVKMAW